MQVTYKDNQLICILTEDENKIMSWVYECYGQDFVKIYLEKFIESRRAQKDDTHLRDLHTLIKDNNQEIPEVIKMLETNIALNKSAKGIV
jgi:hypothetical protein